MKRQIRYEAWETNSSSCHSVCLNNKDAVERFSFKHLYDCNWPETETLEIAFGEFGWGPDFYIDEVRKLKYALTMVAETEHYGSKKEFYETKGFKAINDLIKSNTPFSEGIDIPEECFEAKHKYDPEYYWYIDHESRNYSSLQEFLDDNSVSLYDFIFNPDVVLVIDNDNH